MITDQERVRQRNWIDIGLLIVATFLLVFPMIVNGVPSGNDLQHHYRFALGMNESLSNGIIFPSWDAFTNRGFGDAGLRFYPPLSYVGLSVLATAMSDWYVGSIITFGLLFLIGGIGVYLWAGEWFTRSSSIFGAIVYMSLPYHVNQIYNAFFFAEFAAAAFIPYSFWLVDRIYKKPDLKSSAFLGLAYSVVVLTHLPMALMLSIGLFVYALLSSAGKDILKTSAALVSGIVIGLLLSGFYLIRLLTEVEHLRHSSFTDYDYDYRRNFLLSYFNSSGTDYLDRSLWFGDLMLVLTLLVAFGFGITYFWSQKKDSLRSVFAASGLLITSLFFATPVSSIAWSAIPNLSKIQFPFRWLGLISLASSFIVAAGFRPTIEYFRGQQKAKAILLIGLFVLSISFTYFQIIKSARTLEAAEFRSYIQSLRSTESCECWWPIWAKQAAFLRPERVLAGDREVDVRKWGPHQRDFLVGPGESTRARIGSFYYPHWKATFNGESANVNADDDGSMLVGLNDGVGSIVLVFEEPLANRVAELVSLSTFALVLIVFVIPLFQAAFRKRKAKALIRI